MLAVAAVTAAFFWLRHGALPARDDKPLRKWRATAREAAKQSRRSWFPAVADLFDTASVAGRLASAALAVICHESADQSLADLDVPAAGDVVIVIGPEGSISDDEITVFEAAGAAAYRLGPNVLRTSTAGVVAASLLLSKTSRWS